MNSNPPAKIRSVKCPTCRKLNPFSPENPYRPFCSERCQLIDLGAWAEGKYAIPVQAPADIDAESESEEAADDPKQ